ncbi:MAG TPA: ParB N-terminal domain-containing protein [Kiritimatiellia bacterium]|nr:ParB N-terminal domain-containing protein [Kiritimatiellia bacterium]
MNYRIKEFRMVKTDLLIPGDAAAQFASDEDDRSAVKTSQYDVGTLQPLIIRDLSGKLAGHSEVLDGLGRLRGALEHEDADGNLDPIKELPCLVVECDDPKNLALHINSAGRKRTTGSRVLCFLLANKEKVMAAYGAASYAVKGGCPSHDGHPPRKGSKPGDIPEELKPWTITGISKRLGVSDKDVMMALELMICRDTLTYPSRATFGRYAMGESMRGDDEAINCLDKAYTGVMCGRTPVRRWAAAFAGSSTNGGKGRADTDYAALAQRTAKSLKNVFGHWSSAQWDNKAQREEVERDLASALAIMPECCRLALMELIPQSWGPHEKSALAKLIAKK